ncbi:hypothetical protein AU152_gp69 [Mycobacterium phage Phlei]|uniref:Uncharacterized protein n=1 Tax=Mycobacterium phage Phlei TaxID=1690684 RepID=A0A0N9BDS8_9CAUD|nr:hypothetical protein AU152_gp69 [Mycobacterium phage Phlei]ALA48182.1 hypothetical protein [Mycobacterium phage Phlei]
MKAREIEPRYYEVTDGEKWYSAVQLGDGGFNVMNHKGQIIRQGSAIYRAVIAAIETQL